MGEALLPFLPVLRLDQNDRFRSEHSLLEARLAGPDAPSDFMVSFRASHEHGGHSANHSAEVSPSTVVAAVE